LKKGGKMEEIGDNERIGWKLSFDRRNKEGEAVLNLVHTKSKENFYTKVYKADEKAFQAIMNREMGKTTAEKWRKGESVDHNSYRPIRIPSKFGETIAFLIPEHGRLPTSTDKKAKYVRTVQKGIKQSFEGRKRETNLCMLNRAIEESQPEEIRLHNIVDMGLTFSAMIRLFEKGSKEIVRNEVLARLKSVFKAKSEKELTNIHSRFCDWGTEKLFLAKKREKASYGQVAKTLDVVLKVAIYYSNLPGTKRARKIIKWLNAAVDTKMMALLKKHYPEDIKPWPTAVKNVDKTKYTKIQKIVRKFIKEKYNNKISPVQFDDIFWRELNR
jgi:hypothetical protein